MKVRKSFTEHLVDFIILTIMLCVIIITIYPFLYVFSASINKGALSDGIMWFLPKRVSFDAYIDLFEDRQLWITYANTVYYTVLGTMLNLTLTMLGAYPLSQKQFFIRKQFLYFLLITMYIGGGLIPEYLLINKLGLYNTRWVMILSGAVSVYYIFLARAYIITNIPESLIESAKIEGANEPRILFSIVLPLSKPILATLGLYYGVGHWNDYFTAMIYLPKRTFQPLQLYLMNIVIQNTVPSSAYGEAQGAVETSFLVMQIKYAVIIVAMLPVLMAYPFLQKYFAKGVMVGAVKQ